MKTMPATIVPPDNEDDVCADGCFYCAAPETD